jgi:hypothetical protein
MVGARFWLVGAVAAWVSGCDGGGDGGKDTDTDTQVVDDTVETTETVDTVDSTDTTDPVDTPVDPVDTPGDTIDTPDDTIDTPVDPIDTPVDPIDTPVDPIDTPVDPIDTVDTPVDPIDTPDPVDTPEDTTDTTVYVDPCQVIGDIQRGVTPPGTLVTFDDVVVTAALEDAVFVQCSPGGEYSGIYIACGQPAASILYNDAVVSISGRVEEVASPSGSRTQINTLIPGGFINSYLARLGPAAERVTLDELTDPVTAEPWEGVLVSVRDPRVWEQLTPDVFFIGDADGIIGVSTELSDPGPRAYADHIGELTGVLQWQNDRFELIPRNQGDYQVILTNQSGVAGLTRGSLIVTEWMVDPTDLACVGGAGEYVEVLNTTGAEVDLDGLILYNFDADLQYQVRGHWPLAAGDRAILASAGPANCYGLTSPFGYGWAQPPRPVGIGLYSATDEFDLQFVFGNTLPTGASWELSESALDEAANDSPGNWCTAVSPIGASTDLGTPGAVNDCP